MTRKLEVRDHLRYVDRVDAFDGFELHDDGVRNEQIHPVAAIDADALVCDADAFLALAPEPPLLQLVDQTRLVSRLQKSWSEFPVHLDGRADDDLGEFVSIQTPALANEDDEQARVAATDPE